MSSTVLNSPQLMRVLDCNLKPIDVWVIENPTGVSNNVGGEPNVLFFNEQRSETSQLPLAFNYPTDSACSCEHIGSDFMIPLTPDPVNDHNQAEDLILAYAIVGIPSRYLQVQNTFDQEDLGGVYNPGYPDSPPLTFTPSHLLSPPSPVVMNPECYDLNLNIWIQSPPSLLQHQDPYLQSNIPPLNFESSSMIYPNQMYSNEIELSDWNPSLIHECSDNSQSFQPDFIHPLPPSYAPNITSTNEVCFQTLADNFWFDAAENGSFFVKNELSQISGFVSGNLLEWGFSHPLGVILKHHRNPLTCCFILHSGIICYVKFTPSKIKFANKQSGISYSIDEAGVRTCYESFRSFEDLNVGAQELGNRTYQYSKSFTKDFSQGSQQLMWDFPTQDDGFRVERDGLRFFTKNQNLQMLSLSSKHFNLTSTLNDTGARVGHVFVKSAQHRFKQSVFCNGKSLQVKFHTQTARLDGLGNLSLS